MRTKFCTVSTFAKSSSFFGGSENQILQIQNDIVRRKIGLVHIHVDVSNSGLPYYEKKDGYETFNIGVNTKNPLWELIAYIKIIYLFKSRLKDEVYVTYSRGFYLSFPLLFVKKSFNIPVISIPVGLSSCQTFLQNFRTGKLKSSHFISRLLKDFLIKELSIVCLTEEHKLLIKNNYGFDSSIIPNGAKVTSGFQHYRKFPIVGWIGNSRPVKRLDIFLDIVEKSNDEKAIFVVAGKCTSSDFNRMRDMEKKIRNFKYLGRLRSSKCLKLISNLSVLVNTSDSEGFPNTFVEAWLRRVLVISLNSNPNNLITKKSIGIFCNSDISLMKKSLIKSIRNPSLVKNIGEQSFKYANKTFNIERTVKKLINHSHELLKKD